MADKQILDEMKDPLMHLMRKCHSARYRDSRGAGRKRETTRRMSLQLYVLQTTTKLIIELWDDGRGLDLEAIKQIALKKKTLS